LVQYSIQWDHLHLLAEAVNEFYLAHAAQGLGVRLAKRLNPDLLTYPPVARWTEGRRPAPGARGLDHRKL
jgi:hypothetical protein